MRYVQNGPVIVVGAGLAGLTAAWRLQQAGQEVVVLEATDQVGGRTLRSTDGWLNGEFANLGGELVDSSYHAFRSLCTDLDVTLGDPAQYSAPKEGDLSAMEGYLRVATFVVQGQLLSLEERAELGAELRECAREAPPEPQEIVEQWIRRAGLSARAAGATRALTRFFTQLDPWDCDVHFVFGAPGGSFQRIQGGTQELALALARNLDVRTGQVVTRIERGRSVRIATASGEVVTGSRVICAVGPFAVATLGFDPPLSEHKVMAATSLLPAMAGKVAAQYAEGEEVRAAFGSLVCTDGPVNSAWVSTTDNGAPTGVVTAFLAGADRGFMRSPDIAFAQLDELVEHVTGRRVTRLHGEIKNWWADPFALGVTVAPAQQSRSVISSVLAAIEDETHFAGDYTDGPMCGTLEGAVRSGLRAANEVLRAPEIFHTDYVTARLSRA